MRSDGGVSAPRASSGSASDVPASRVDLQGVPFAKVTERECVTHIANAAAKGEGGWLVTPNLEIHRQCRSDRAIREMVGGADMVVADGMPLIWASRLQGTPLPERVCGSNVILSLSAAAAERGLRVFLLGGADDTAERTAALLRKRHGTNVVGAYGPPFGFEKELEEMERIRRMIRGSHPHVVFFGLPFPKGEHVLMRIRDAAPNAWWCGVGVAFSFVCGDVIRAPRWMQKSGLEWMHRLQQEPRRLFRRYVVDGIPYVFPLLAGSVMGRFRRR